MSMRTEMSATWSATILITIYLALLGLVVWGVFQWFH